MRGPLTKLEPVHAPLIPPEGSVAAGFTPDGTKALWTRTYRVNRPEPVFDKDGNREYTRNANGDRVIAKNKPVIVEETELFYLESDGNNNVYKVPYKHPTEAEIKAAERAAKIKALGGGPLAEAMVDAGMSPAEFVAAMKNRAATDAGRLAVPDGTPSDKTPDIMEYPHHKGASWWLLSNGEQFQGSKVAAIEAEAAVVAARNEESPVY